MAEYVTKYQVKEEILSWARSITNPERIIMADAMYVIDMLPSADVRPVVRGKWKMDSDRPDALICSACDHAFDVWKWDHQWMHFCPNCGADMRDGDAE